MRMIKRNTGLFPSLFDDWFIENRLDREDYETFSIPAVNISENFSIFAIEIAAPGLEKENFSIELDKQVLTISSKNNSEDQSGSENNRKFKRREFNYGEFTRSFKIPETVNMNEIGANYENGILSITLPKKEVEEDIKRMVEIS